MGGRGPRYDLAVLGSAILCGIGVCAFCAPANAQNLPLRTTPMGLQTAEVIPPPTGPTGYGAPVAPSPGGGGQAPAATGKSFRVSTGVSVAETYNDNVTLAPKGSERTDYITQVTPNLGIVDQGARVQFGLTYDPQLLYYAEGTYSTRVQQNLQGVGHAELYPEIFFVDANASISQQFLSSSGPIGASTTTGNSNLQTVQDYSVSPYLRHHFGSYADSESRYRFTSVIVGGNTVAPIQIHEARQTLASGDYFGRLGWLLTGDSQWYNRGQVAGDSLSNTSATDKYGRADAKYLLYRGLSALAGVGYESLHDSTLLEHLKGVIWDAGFEYQPAPYAKVSFTYGRRFNSTDYEFNGEYDIGPRLKVLSSYTETYQTGLSLVAANGAQLTLNQSGQLVNSQTGLPVTGTPYGVASSSPFGISNQGFIDKRFQATVVATRWRNTYTVTGFEDRQSGAAVSSVFTNTNARTYGGRVDWTRQLWPNLASNLGGQYSDISYLDGSGRKDTLYFINAGLTYTFSPSLTGRLDFIRSSRESNVPQDSIDDDVVTIWLQKQF